MVNSSFLKLLLVAFLLVKWNKSQSWELLNFSTAVSAKCILFRELPTGLVFAVPVNFLICFPAENFFCKEQFDFFFFPHWVRFIQNLEFTNRFYEGVISSNGMSFFVS